MSEIADTPSGAPRIGHTSIGPLVEEIAHEAYAFACMRCGHGWEQSYDIEHRMDADGRAFVVYFADGRRVRSPLTSPHCENCGHQVVRIMASGRVSSVAASLRRAVEMEIEGSAPDERPALRREHHWHLSDLLHPFHHRK